MRIRKFTLYILMGMLLCSLFSCSKEDKKNRIINQEVSIDNFIKGKYRDSTVIINDGARRIVIEKGNPERQLEFGDSLYLYYAGYIFQNGPSAIFSTNVKEIAEGSGLNLSHPYYEVVKLRYEKGMMIKGLELGLYHIAEREHSLIVFSAKYGYDNEEVAIVPKLSALMFEVWIDKIVKNK